MKRKLMILGIGIVMLLLVVAAPVLNARGKPQIPFVGMSLVYYANDSFHGSYSRSVVVLKYYPDTDSVLIKDSHSGDPEQQNNYFIIEVASRTITWVKGWWEPYIEVGVDTTDLWIPTNIKIGSGVDIGNWHAEVIGSAVLSVGGKDVECWQLYATWTDPNNPAVTYEDTLYYAKRTGLMIAASWVVLADGDPGPLNCWAGHLASTNVPLL